MKISKTVSLRVFPLLLVIISLAITGCKRPRPVAEPGPEPGLFSGKKGEVIIFSNKKRKRR
jgi:hypothetical protein